MVPATTKRRFVNVVKWTKRAGAAAVFGLAMSGHAAAAATDQWPSAGQNLQNWRNQPNTTISAENVGRLKLKWEFTTGGDISATPAVVGGVVYFPDFGGNFYALNAKTGAVIWQHQISDWTGIVGDWSRNAPLITNGRVILGNQAGGNWAWNGTEVVGPGARVIAVDAASGKLIWVTKPDDSPFILETAAPVIYNGIVYVGLASSEEDTSGAQGNPCCVSSGSVVALDLKTGKKLWQTRTMPENYGQLGGYAGGGIWDTPAIDPKRNSLYVGTGNNYAASAAATACIKLYPTNKNCTAADDYFDSVLALDLTTGAVKWAHRALAWDVFNGGCAFTVLVTCPGGVPGQDYDFGGSGPNLLTLHRPDIFGVAAKDIVGVGEKSGVYYAFDPDDGSIIWNTQVGPGSYLGGVEWGTATDGKRIYVPITNIYYEPFVLQPSGKRVNGGSWAAIDPATGDFLWQVGAPGKCSPATADYAQGCASIGAASVANGVVFVGTMETDPAKPSYFALDARTGKTLWSYASGASVNAAAVIVGDSVYWGTGYSSLGSVLPGTTNNKFYAFHLPGERDD